VCNVIVEICCFRAYRAEELVTLLERHPRYVQNNYLRLLTQASRLMMVNPSESSDSQQVYRTLKSASRLTL